MAFGRACVCCPGVRLPIGINASLFPMGPTVGVVIGQCETGVQCCVQGDPQH